MSDFTGAPWLAEDIFGMRSWDVDKLGRLTAANHPFTVWTPGENVARCLKSDYDGSAAMSGFMASAIRQMYVQGGFLPERGSGSRARKPVSLEKHTVAGRTCKCGFYAYFDGSDEYRDPSRVTGIIQGWGRVTIGDRGFRAEKAKIVALVIRPRQQKANGPLMDKVRHNYSGIPFFDRKRDALAAFPLTPPEPVTPESCADFWTRSAS